MSLNASAEAVPSGHLSGREKYVLYGQALVHVFRVLTKGL